MISMVFLHLLHWKHQPRNTIIYQLYTQMFLIHAHHKKKTNSYKTHLKAIYVDDLPVSFPGFFHAQASWSPGSKLHPCTPWNPWSSPWRDGGRPGPGVRHLSCGLVISMGKSRKSQNKMDDMTGGTPMTWETLILPWNNENDHNDTDRCGLSRWILIVEWV